MLIGYPVRRNYAPRSERNSARIEGEFIASRKREKKIFQRRGRRSIVFRYRSASRRRSSRLRFERWKTIYNFNPISLSRYDAQLTSIILRRYISPGKLITFLFFLSRFSIIFPDLKCDDCWSSRSEKFSFRGLVGLRRVDARYATSLGSLVNFRFPRLLD